MHHRYHLSFLYKIQNLSDGNGTIHPSITRVFGGITLGGIYLSFCRNNQQNLKFFHSWDPIFKPRHVKTGPLVGLEICDLVLRFSKYQIAMNSETTCRK